MTFNFIVYFSNYKRFVKVEKNRIKCPSSIRCWDSNSQPSEHESPPITTRPGQAPTLILLRRLRPVGQKFDERIFLDLDFADRPQPLLALGLLRQKLHLSPDVAAVAFRRHVFAVRLQIFPRKNLWIGRCLKMKNFKNKNSCSAAEQLPLTREVGSFKLVNLTWNVKCQSL